MKSLSARYTASNSGSYETFADLVFCALVVLVLFVMALAIEVSQRVRTDVTRVAEVTQKEVIVDEAELPPQHESGPSDKQQDLAHELNGRIHQMLSHSNSIRCELESQLKCQQEKLTTQQAEIQRLRSQIANQAAKQTTGKPDVTQPIIATQRVLKLRCQGWWEQAGVGRQEMKEFEVEVRDGRLHGKGVDITGEFVVRGRMDKDQISIQKTYLGQHSVDYQGKKCGAGVFRGNWSQRENGSGPWLIRICPMTMAIPEVFGDD